MSDLLALTVTPDSDAGVAALAREMTARGARVAGAVQRSTPQEMALASVCGTRRWVISQRLGAGARGCTLDPGALEQAVAAIAPDLSGAALFVVNRFGKQEAAGRGFAPLIAQALDTAIPVLVSVPAPHRAAFDGFAGDLARWVTPDEARARFLAPA